MPLNPNFLVYSAAPPWPWSPELFGHVDGFPEVEHRLTVTKSYEPIETGASLTDHAVRDPDRLELTAWVTDRDPALGIERPARAWERINDLMDARKTLTVVTPWRVYRNMMIISAQARQTRETSGAVNCALRLEQVLFVDVDGAFTPARTSGPASERTPAREAGEVRPVTLPEDDSSLVDYEPGPFGVQRRRPVAGPVPPGVAGGVVGGGA